MKMKMKKIICFIITAVILTTSVLSLTSCDSKPDIYVLIENILQNKDGGFYTFDAELNIKIKTNSDIIPDELNFIINGKGEQDIVMLNLAIYDESENLDIKTGIYKQGNMLYVELNDISRIIFDLLYSTGFLDAQVRFLFDDEIEYDTDFVLCFDLTDFDLSFFDKYIKNIEKVFTVNSSVKYDFEDNNVDFPALFFDEENLVYFSDIKTKIEKELLKLPGYRYYELYVVMEVDENKNSFMNILATRETGETEILEKYKLDCDLAKAMKNHDSIYTESIIPMRYLWELLGETVGWDSVVKKAYLTEKTEKTENGKNVYFDGKLINSKTYISLFQIMTHGDYNLNFISVDEYIEFKITRKY